MMKPRALVPFISLVSSTPTMEDTVNDLRSELRRTQAKLVDESRKRAEAEAHVAILKRQREKPPIIPHGDEIDGYECPNAGCYCHLEEDWRYCPGCGAEIDWRTWTAPEDSNAYDLHFDR